MSPRAKQQCTFILPEWLVVQIHSNGIGTGLLYTIRDRECCSQLNLVAQFSCSYKQLEQLLMLFRHRKMNVHATLCIFGIQGAFRKMFAYGCAVTFGIGVKKQQPLGHTSIIKTLGMKQCHNHLFVPTLLT